ncbi:MAG TPA: amidohydrolase family protein [Thermomicrobiales bacterium]|nr:amidohydrolase family protein [Thermomicrobiales bacterium]
MATTATRQTTGRRARLGLIDCDIHNTVPSGETLARYLPERWRAFHARYGVPGYGGDYYPKANPNAARLDAWPPSGPPGSDLAFLRAQLLDAWGIECGILNCLLPAGSRHLEYAAALASAINDWQLAEWLEPEPRLRAALVLPFEDGDLAAAEIDRLGGDPRFVQALLLARTAEPLGRRRYWKIYEAAARHDLPVAIHFGGAAGHPITGAGWPSYYVEDHTGMAQSFQAQVTSLVVEGVFERFPTLRVVLVEGGFAWLPPLMWRLDRAWRLLGDETPEVRRPPSAYIREHVWITTQPMEEPTAPAQFHQLLDQLGMDDRLLFATDYPHWDFDAPDQALPVKLAPALERRIMAENARTLYRL